MTTQNRAEMHNKIAGDVVRLMFKPVSDYGATTSDVMVILESVVTGVLAACAAFDKQDAATCDQMLMALECRVRGRLDALKF